MSKFDISIDEALKLSKHGCLVSHINYGYDLAEAFLATEEGRASSFAPGTCFYAGIVEGIRRERARHKKQIKILKARKCDV